MRTAGEHIDMLSLLLDRKASAETVDRVCHVIPCHAMGIRKYESIQISLAQLLRLLFVCMYVLLTLLYAALRMEMLRYIGLRLMGSSKWWSVYSIKARP